MLPLLCGTIAVPVERAEGSVDRHKHPRELVTGPHARTLKALFEDGVGDQQNLFRETSLLDIVQERHFSSVNSSHSLEAA